MVRRNRVRIVHGVHEEVVAIGVPDEQFPHLTRFKNDHRQRMRGFRNEAPHPELVQLVEPAQLPDDCSVCTEHVDEDGGAPPVGAARHVWKPK